MVKEVLTIHVGQAGCQVGSKCWELFCLEHQINPNGTRPHIPDEELDDGKDHAFESFFSETSHGQFVPRAIFVDTDPTTKHEINQGTYGRLFHPDNVIGYNQDCANNFFVGRTFASHFQIKEDVMEKVRKAVDNCQNLQGFFFFHAFGGGTGSGIGIDLLDEIRTHFAKKNIIEPVIYPSYKYSSCIVEPYNCIFATHYSRDLVDLSLMFDNEASYRMCQTNLAVKNPSFDHINRLIAQCISNCTGSVRYKSELNATLPEIVTNLVPMGQYRYPIVSLSPVRHPQRGAHEQFTTAEIITDLFEERNLLCDCGQYLKLNRYLAAVILLRGEDEESEVAPDLNATSGSAKGGGGSAKKRPIQVNTALGALRDMTNPKGSHRKPIRFLPWMESGGFKVGVVDEPPHVTTDENGDKFMASSKRQGCMIGNTTAVRQIFVRQYTKFLKLFYHKAYVWQFLDANGEIDLFYEAREGVRQIIDNYENLLKECIQVEEQGPGDSTVTLKQG
mmetsp:Transcript_75054/g.160818  ORF Transcript_75054/g.160818 Transcript_75054/m.160818 type:complete len:503 (+) Transcript_75054:213-1721(+)